MFPDGKPYGPCQDSVGPTWELKPGRVNYLGELTYSFENSELRVSYDIREDRARAFLNASHAGYTSAFLTQAAIPMTIRSNVCDGRRVTIRVFTPHGVKALRGGDYNIPGFAFIPNGVAAPAPQVAPVSPAPTPAPPAP